MEFVPKATYQVNQLQVFTYTNALPQGTTRIDLQIDITDDLDATSIWDVKLEARNGSIRSLGQCSRVGGTAVDKQGNTVTTALFTTVFPAIEITSDLAVYLVAKVADVNIGIEGTIS